MSKGSCQSADQKQGLQQLTLSRPAHPLLLTCLSPPRSEAQGFWPLRVRPAAQVGLHPTEGQATGLEHKSHRCACACSISRAPRGAAGFMRYAKSLCCMRQGHLPLPDCGFREIRHARLQRDTKAAEHPHLQGWAGHQNISLANVGAELCQALHGHWLVCSPQDHHCAATHYTVQHLPGVDGLPSCRQAPSL